MVTCLGYSEITAILRCLLLDLDSVLMSSCHSWNPKWKIASTWSKIWTDFSRATLKWPSLPFFALHVMEWFRTADKSSLLTNTLKLRDSTSFLEQKRTCEWPHRPSQMPTSWEFLHVAGKFFSWLSTQDAYHWQTGMKFFYRRDCKINAALKKWWNNSPSNLLTS